MTVDLSKIEKLYSDNLQEFGVDSRSVGWSSAESQNLRFEKLLAVVDDPSQPFSVNELGCGYGEMLKYMRGNSFAVEQFRGYDISSEMLDAAKVYLDGEPGVSLHHAAQFEQPADYSFTSGIFNVRFDTPHDKWTAYIKSTLKHLNEKSTKGFAFNLLSSYVDYEAENLFYADPAIFFDFCKRNCSRFVTLLHDYPLWEWTIIVRKGNRSELNAQLSNQGTS